MRLLTLPFLALSWGGLAADTSPPSRAQLTVRTTTGTYIGMQNPEYGSVREFRNIPYALPPTGRRRWRPPVPVAPSRGGSHRFSRRFPPPCAQFLSGQESLWNANMTDFQLRVGEGQAYTAGASAQTSSEDCLSLAVWTPADVRADAALPVMLFIPGGSYTVGGIDIPYQNPAPWVARSGAHIAVVAQYRLGVYGYPNAAGLAGDADGANNAGVLDVHAALGWVYANVAAFGGDRDRITLWGHSAGGVLADMAGFAFPDDFVAAGLFLMSGTGMYIPGTSDPDHTNFTFVARRVGCDFAGEDDDGGAAELECMRQVPETLLTNVVGRYGDQRTEPGLNFKPRADEVVVFSNPMARAAAGRLPRVPALVSTTANEQASRIRYPKENVAKGPDQAEVDKGTVGFNCVVSNTTDARARAGLPTYRYQFAGNYTGSLGPLPWMGAYHGIDLPLLFGTYARRLGGLGPDDAAELTRVSEAMQDYVLAFISDPVDGLRKRGWLPQTTPAMEGGPMMRFAWRGRTAVNISSSEVDDSCLRGVPWNANP
ncbi:hypothetical protein RB597_005372 [Gaeumannomyces tritici]